MQSVAPPTSEPVPSARHPSLRRDLLILLGLWLLAAVVDRTWVFLDQAPPHWDQGDHLTRALNHWRVLQHPSWFSSEWWRTLWQQAPTQRAPLVYLLTVPFFALLGVSIDSALTVNLFFSVVLIGSVYGMGRRLFETNVGLWAAGLSLLAPTLARLRLDYLLDYGLTAVTAFTTMGLTYWWTAKTQRSQWGFTLLWGVGAGLMLLTRTSALLFLFATVGWLTLLSLFSRRWSRLLQVIAGAVVAGLLIWPWFSASWLTIISTTISGLAYGVTYRSDPQANSLAGWFYYPSKFPEMVSSPVLFLALAAGGVALVGLLLPWQRLRPQPLNHPITAQTTAWFWLGGTLLFTLALGAVGSNKEPRFLAPLIPVLSVALARLLWWRRDRTWQLLRWLAALSSALLLMWTLFPLPGSSLSRSSGYPYTGTLWPHPAIVDVMTQQAPYLEANLGMATNTVELNPFGMEFYGQAANFQVTARQLGLRPETAPQDARALDWYLTKTGDQGAYGAIEEGQALLKASILNSPDLEVFRTWSLPDGSEAQLYHRRQPQVEVEPVNGSPKQIELSWVDAPARLMAGQAAPITYRLVGPWADLQHGLILLSWQAENSQGLPRWVSDHGIGLGHLYGQGEAAESFAVIERLAIAPPADLPPGLYSLEATFIDRATQRSYAVRLPSTQIELLPPAADPAEPLAPGSPPLDLVTVLRQLSQGLATGDIDPIFAEVGRINQYDPQQDYLVQAEQALDFRLQQSPDNLEWLYGKALAQVLQQDAPAAIASLDRITEVAPDNPYHWTYLGFVHLYSWQPRRAQAALDQAAILKPDLPDLKLLQAAAALLQLQIPRGISLLKEAGVL